MIEKFGGGGGDVGADAIQNSPPVCVLIHADVWCGCRWLDNQGLVGPIPQSISNLKNLTMLKIAGNGLTDIPSSISGLAVLTQIDLSHNEISGTIPAGFSALVQLQYIDISHNNLASSIPASFSGLRKLKSMLLSKNNLSGPIPPSLYWKPHLPGKLVEEATNNWSEDNQLGSGAFGDVFKGVSPRDGVTEWAVKRAKLIDVDFQREVQQMADKNHPNIVRLLGFAVGGDMRTRPEQVLIYEFVPNGDLERWLDPASESTFNAPRACDDTFHNCVPYAACSIPCA
ncbi:unnamed protein product [Closterium sp. Yama58-4]|nr:unnamed protein product [Closterium sp. Yama58-4]